MHVLLFLIDDFILINSQWKLKVMLIVLRPLLMQEISIVIKFCKPQATTVYWIASGGRNAVKHAFICAASFEELKNLNEKRLPKNTDPYPHQAFRRA